MTNFTYRLIIFLVSILCFLTSCNNSGVNPPPPPPPEMTADLSGYDSLRYESQVLPTTIDLNDRLQVCLSGYMDSAKIGMVVSIYYLDKKEKTGTFDIVNSSLGLTTDYAMAAFFIGSGDNQKVFYADSGKVVITQIQGLDINGTFKFYSTERNGDSHIIVDNGVLDIKW
jgi:hypothetical protein